MAQQFKEVFDDWVASEFLALYEIQQQKTHFIKVFNKKAAKAKSLNHQDTLKKESTT